MPIVRRINLSQNDLMDCKIIKLKGEEKVILVGSLIVVNVLKFNKNNVDRPILCQSVRMERLYCQDSKPKVL